MKYTIIIGIRIFLLIYIERGNIMANKINSESPCEEMDLKIFKNCASNHINKNIELL